MRKVVLIMLLVMGLFIWRYEAVNETDQKIQLTLQPTTQQLSPTPFISEKTISDDGVTYGYFVSDPIKAENLKLVGNYSEQLSTEFIMERNRCSFGINGGFYDTNNRPLGWTVINGQEIASDRESQLFNGYIGIGKNLISLEMVKPEREVDSGLQTGPMLMNNSRPISLKMATDKNARRMVMAINNKGEAMFMAFTNQLLSDSGPMLETLPKLIQIAATKEGLNLTKAVNLDGGSASAINSSEFKLFESKPVGSWWCGK